MAQVFYTTLQKVLSSTPGYGNCRAVESVENELHVFHRSHRAWKTRNGIEFSTVPTASTTGYRYEKKTEKRFSKA